MWQVRLLRLGAALPQYPEVLDLINRRRVGYGFPGMAVVGRLRLRRTTSLLLLQVHHRRNVVERKDLNTFLESRLSKLSLFGTFGKQGLQKYGREDMYYYNDSHAPSTLSGRMFTPSGRV